MSLTIDSTRFPAIAAWGGGKAVKAVGERLRGRALEFMDLAEQMRRSEEEHARLKSTAIGLVTPPRDRQESRRLDELEAAWGEWGEKLRPLARRMRAVARDPTLTVMPGARPLLETMEFFADAHLASERRARLLETKLGEGPPPKEGFASAEETMKDFAAELQSFGESMRSYAEGLLRGEGLDMEALERVLTESMREGSGSAERV